MASSATRERYGFVSILLHWLMLALLVGVYVAAELRDGLMARMLPGRA